MEDCFVRLERRADVRPAGRRDFRITTETGEAVVRRSEVAVTVRRPGPALRRSVMWHKVGRLA
ncbi:hypothetical protein GCM10010211_11800 [Streptomyces albospinus]|uniref:Uncharacterized protein n=1 Tax=Streptomyces albospinus TaxID=285515 RepID=A0ABQ2USL2_9ACTN|nr:hypothetical protein GCM10010211_11800 [Streptomyces albospinus]